jgi:putative iron-dependent peroxidase
MSSQPGILAPLPRVARHLTLRLTEPELARAALGALGGLDVADDVVVGLGPSLLSAAGFTVPGLHELARPEGAAVEVPVTPRAVWLWLRGDDTGALIVRGRELAAQLSPMLEVEEAVDSFVHLDSRDLSGFEDGTENPEGEAAEAAALCRGRGADLEGSSFVVVQRWVHDLDRLSALDTAAQSRLIGRDKVTNEELADAPASAHVKRTEQESFDPPAFVLRRSMPWSSGREHGLVFVAFGASLRAFDLLLRRMVGADDGVVDGLFSFTRPVTGAAFWCPPVRDGRLNLAALASGS